MSGKARPKRIVAVDWDAHTLRVVHAVLGQRGVKIDKLLSVEIPADLDVANVEQMGGYIRRTLDQEGITTRHAVLDVPRDQAILKTLTLPTSQPDELPGMVKIQIAKELPFPVSDAAVDFAVAPTEEASPTGDVLVAAVRREMLEQYEAISEKAGLKLDRVGLRPYANKEAVGALLKHAMPERVVFIDVRPTFMEIDVLRRSALAFSRSASVVIPSGRGDTGILSLGDLRFGDDAGGSIGDAGKAPLIRRANAVIDSLMLEVTRSIEAYRAGDPGARIDHAVIGGDVGVEEALAEAIQKRLGITTELYNPASTFGWEPDEGAAASAFAALLGLVLGYADAHAVHFDFLHPKKTVSRTQERLKMAPIAAAIVALFVVAGGVVVAGVTKPKRDALAGLERDIAELEAQSSENLKFLEVINQIEAFDGQQIVWIDVLNDLIALLPSNQEMVIDQMELDQRETRIKLKTRTKQPETPTVVIRALGEFRRDGRENAPRFEVSMGPQAEKKGEKYPFYQDLRITVLDDSKGAKGRGSPSSGG